MEYLDTLKQLCKNANVRQNDVYAVEEKTIGKENCLKVFHNGNEVVSYKSESHSHEHLANYALDKLFQSGLSSCEKTSDFIKEQQNKPQAC